MGHDFRPEYAALGQLRQRFPFAVYGIDRHRRRHHAPGDIIRLLEERSVNPDQ